MSWKSSYSLLGGRRSQFYVTLTDSRLASLNSSSAILGESSTGNSTAMKNSSINLATGLIPGRMKFNQRLFILFGATFFSFAFFLLFDTGMPWPQVHTSRTRMLAVKLWQHQLQSRQSSWKGDCQASPSTDLVVTANFSTFDMAPKLVYEVLADGSYPLPNANKAISPISSSSSSFFSSSSSLILEKGAAAAATTSTEQAEMIAAAAEAASSRNGARPTKKEDPFTVILVPHSHNDPGWLKTVDEYYADQTKHILDNMVRKLTTYPNMTFVWAETIYLAMWWNDQEDAVKAQVRRLIRRGQLEIVLGSWVMPDEATTHYYAIVDQLIEGHRWVMDNLHILPKNSWSIDPFGHSGTMPYLWKEAGLQNMVIQRIHGAVKNHLAKHKGLEFMWRQYWDDRGDTDILCHVMPYMLYSIKFTCGPDRFLCLLYDFRNIPGEQREGKSRDISVKNIEVQAEYLYREYRKKNFLYKYNAILVPLGDDFRFDKEIEWDQQYKNYAMLFQYMNSRKDWNIHLKFGTPQDYFEIIRKRRRRNPSVSKEKTPDIPVLSGDFFPYSDQSNAYWTGYYTTRPFDKRFSRDIESALRAADILYFLACSYSKMWDKPYEKAFETAGMLKRARRYLGLFQHHDAITGTAKEYVVMDYEEKLAIAYNITQTVIGNALEVLLYRSKSGLANFFIPETVRTSPTTSASKRVLQLEKTGLQLVIFNPLVQQRQDVVSVLVTTNKIEVLDEKQKVIPSQIIPVWEDDITVSSNIFELVFLINIEPLTTVVYTLRKPVGEMKNTYTSTIGIVNSKLLVVPPDTGFLEDKPWDGNPKPIVIENSLLKASFSGARGLLESVFDKNSGNTTKVNIDFQAYLSQGSGAYLFLPNGRARSITGKSQITRIVQGPLVSEVQVLHQFFQHRVRLYDVPGIQQTALHIDNKLNIKGLRDREVIMKLKTDIKNENETFFTDQNGFQMIGRRNQHRLRLEANYYPITTMVMLEDDNRRLTLHADHSHGVAGLEQGSVEIMLDRQLSYDDERGLGEGVEDIKPVHSRYVLQIEYRGSDDVGSPGERPSNTETVQEGSEVEKNTLISNMIKNTVENNKIVQNGPKPLAPSSIEIDHTNKISNRQSHSKHQERQLRFTFPSLLGVHLNNYLQRPLVVYFTNMDADFLVPKFRPVEGPLPCDVSLVSLRVLVNSDLMRNGTSLILHRQGMTCGFPASEPVCSVDWGKVSVSSLFGKIQLKDFRRTSLSHLHSLETLSPKSVLKLKPMELASYILKT